MNELKLATEMSKFVHDQCNDAPHDIGLKLLEFGFLPYPNVQI